ncbi:MAG: ABC-type transport auxiliary lipoprotein family protein [Candidatus Binatia bacterium]
MMRAACLASLALLCAGCLFNNAPAPRYYAPPSALINGDPPVASAGDPAPQPVRVRRVRSAAYLGEQMAWRVSPVERGLYEQRRWTEAPTRYLERTVARAIDQTPGLRRVESGRVPTLDLELVSFDEELAPVHSATVEIAAALHGADGGMIFERVFAVSRPVGGSAPDATARAMGDALDGVALQIAAQVAADLPR